MADNHIGRLLQGLWGDLRDPDILWQVGVLALCVALAWWLSRQAQWRAPDGSREALKRGAAALRRVAFPLLAMVLLLTARPALGNWHSTSLLSVAIPLFGALAGIRFAVYLLRIAFAESRALDTFERSIGALIWVLLALHLTGLLPEMVRWMREVELSVGKSSLSLWTLLSAMFWVALTVLLALWAGTALETRLMRAEGLHSSLQVVFGRLGKGLLLVVSVLVVLPLIGVDLTVLSVFGGALGVGLGFGMQKIFSNFVSGFIILLDRSIRLGDIITVDNQYGAVTRITTRYTMVRTQTGIEAIIPNDSMITTTVLNHSFSDRNVRLAVRVQVGYGTDVPAALALLAGLAARHERVLKDPEPVAQVVNLAESGIDLELGFWIRDPEGGSQNVRSDVLVTVLSEFKAQGIEIPFPQRHVRVLQGNSGN